MGDGGAPLFRRPPPAPDVALPKAQAPSTWELIAQTLGGMIGVPPIGDEDYSTPEGTRRIQQAGALGELLTMGLGAGTLGAVIAGGKKAMKAKPGTIGELVGPRRIPNPIQAHHGSPHDFPGVAEVVFQDGGRYTVPLGQELAPEMAAAIKSGKATVTEHPLGKFDLSKIGTGEGGQAYGYGLYFAENPAVGQQYRKQLSAQDVVSSRMQSLLETHDNNLDLALDEFMRGVYDTPKAKAKMRADLRELWSKKPPTGRMYEVNLHVTPEELLDWDKPLSEQPQKVREALQQLGVSGDTARAHVLRDAAGNINFSATSGEGVYQELVRRAGGRAGHTEGTVSAMLEKAGIKGIQYLDQGSRGAASVDRWVVSNMAADGHSINSFTFPSEVEAKQFLQSRNYQKQAKQFGYAKSDIEKIPAKPGTRNFVIFDDQLIEIKRKFGFATTLAAAEWVRQNGGIVQKRDSS